MSEHLEAQKRAIRHVLEVTGLSIDQVAQCVHLQSETVRKYAGGYQPASQRTMATIKSLAAHMPLGGARGKLKYARGKAVLSQAELAKRAGVPISLIQN